MIRRVVAVLALLACASGYAWAGGGAPVVMSTSGSPNTGVDLLRVVPASDGGAFSIFDCTTCSGLSVQRSTSVGARAWDAGPVPTGVPYSSISPAAVRSVADGVGGVIVSTGRQLQRIAANGLARWNLGTVTFGTSSLVGKTDVVSDGVGGAFVVWDESTNLYAQHVDSLGTLLWSGLGVPVCTATGTQSNPAIVEDGVGGVIITWLDARAAPSSMYAQRLNGAGVAQWAANGVAVSGPVTQSPAMISDGQNGAILVLASTNIVLQRLGPGGASLWGSGLTLTGASYSLSDSRPAPICRDGQGGAYVCWAASGVARAQRVLSGGGLGWAPGGVVVAMSPGSQTQPAISPDGAGGVFVAWTDQRALIMAEGIYAQRLDNAGSRLWGDAGVEVCDAPGRQEDVRIERASDGALLAAWDDGRRSGDASEAIYFQRLSPAGTPQIGDLDLPALESVADVRNDQGGRVALRWRASALDAPGLGFSYLGTRGPALVTSYRIWRRIPEAWALDARGAIVRPGVFRRADPTTSASTYWEPIGTVPGEYLPRYAFTAATHQDSLPDSNPYTAFFVTALGRDSALFYASNVDSGYSVDNLAPAPPGPFTGGYSAGAVHLHWRDNDEADFSHYELHRGSSADFVPDDANRLVAQPDTGFADPSAPGRYYKLAALDVHGNRSGYSLLAPQAVSGAPGSDPAGVAFVGLPAPNPMAGGTSFVIRARAGASVRAEVFDELGRRVRRLFEATSAGEPQTVTWDGNDGRGQRVRSGQYHVLVHAGAARIERRVTVMR